jgi:hypothetical protein
MERAIDYLKYNALKPVPDADGTPIPDLLAAWETDDLMDPQSPPHTAKLGGAGLALIALCEMESIQPQTTSLEEIRQLGNFIVYMQNDDGSYTCKYSYKYGKNDDWTSLYYPGEAALGLLYLYELEDRLGDTNNNNNNNNAAQQQKWLQVATKTLLYLEQIRRNEDLEDIEADHWALLATAKLLPILEDKFYDTNAMEYHLVYNHAVRVAQSMVASHTMDGLKEHIGCFTYDRRTCPTSTRLEGLLAALTFVKEHEMFIGEEEHIVEPLRDRIEESVAHGIRFLLGAQQVALDNNMQGGVPERYPSHNEDDTNVRVDYVQHSMSAMIAYEQYMKQKKNDKKLMRRGMDRLKKIGKDVADRTKKVVNKNGPNGDSYVNYLLLIVLFVAVALIAAVVYMPKGKRRKHKKKT